MRRPSVGCHTSYREGGQGHEVFPEKFFPRSLEPFLRGAHLYLGASAAGYLCTRVTVQPGTRPSVHPRICSAGDLYTCTPVHLCTRGPAALEIRAPAHLGPRPARHPHLARSHVLPRDRTDQTEVAPGGPRSYRHARTRPDPASSLRVRTTSTSVVRPRREMYDLDVRCATSRAPGRAEPVTRPARSPDQPGHPTSPVARPARSGPAQPTATSGRCGVVNPAAPWGTRGVSPVAVPTALTPAATAVEACRLARSAIAAK